MLLLGELTETRSNPSDGLDGDITLTEDLRLPDLTPAELPIPSTAPGEAADTGLPSPLTAIFGFVLFLFPRAEIKSCPLPAPPL